MFSQKKSLCSYLDGKRNIIEIEILFTLFITEYASVIVSWGSDLDIWSSRGQPPVLELIPDSATSGENQVVIILSEC